MHAGICQHLIMCGALYEWAGCIFYCSDRQDGLQNVGLIGSVSLAVSDSAVPHPAFGTPAPYTVAALCPCRQLAVPEPDIVTCEVL
jgi:hypothetical protein